MKPVFSSSAKCSLFSLVFFRLWSKCPKIVASDFAMCLEISLAVSPDHVSKFTFLCP